MLEAYIDDSASEKGEYLVLAGYIANSEDWQIIEEKWQKLLNQFNMKFFKFTAEIKSGKKRARCEQFYRVIEEHVICAISIMVKQSDLEEVVDKVTPPPNITNWDKLKNPYYTALRALVQHVNLNLERMKIDEHVKFIFDEQTEKNLIQDNWKYMYESVTNDLKKKLDKEPTFMRDNEKIALQTADMWAGFVRKWAEKELNEPIKDLDFRSLKFHWHTNKDLLRAHVSITKDDLMKEFLKAKEIHIEKYIRYRFC